MYITIRIHMLIYPKKNSCHEWGWTLTTLNSDHDPGSNLEVLLLI